MLFGLSRDEVALLTGAGLTYGFVPFHFSKKRRLTGTERRMADDVWNRLIIRRDATPATAGLIAVELSIQEVMLYVEILRACLAESSNDPVYLRLHLSTSNGAELEYLAKKLEETVR